MAGWTGGWMDGWIDSRRHSDSLYMITIFMASAKKAIILILAAARAIPWICHVSILRVLWGRLQAIGGTAPLE